MVDSNLSSFLPGISLDPCDLVLEREEVSMGLGPILFGSFSQACCSAGIVDCPTASTSVKRFKLDFRLLSSRDKCVDCEPFCMAAGVLPQTVQPKAVFCRNG